MRLYVKQASVFAAVGASSVVFDFLTYSYSKQFLAMEYAKIIGFYSGVFLSFLGNSLLTFRKRNGPKVKFKLGFKYIVVSNIAMVFNVSVNSAAFILLNTLPMNIATNLAHGLAFCCATSVSMCVNFTLFKFWVFK